MTPPAEDPHTASFTTAFLSYPHASSYNSHIDKLRSHEYPHLANQTYLDHAGATPYPRTILSAHGTDLLSTLYSNPHSAGSPGGDATRERVRAVRERVLRYLGASLEDYVVVFTSGATAGLRIVGEGLQWSKTGAEYWHLREVHTSVLGIRRFVDNDDDDNDDAYREGWVKDSAHAKGHKLKRTKCVTTEDVEAFLKPEIEAIYRDVLGANLMNDVGDAYNLFAFPAQCNHSGRRYPLSYINLFRLKNKSLHSSSSTSVSNPNNLPWRTLLDAASHLTTTPINLSSHPADFVVLSFYKLFGFPTGLGALVMRRDAALSLRKRYFGGGTVSSIVSDIPWQAFRGNDHLAARFEDGTIPFLQVLAVEKGFEFVEGVLGGWSSVSLHAECIAGFVYEQMSAMRHHNDQQPLCRMYSRHPAPSARHEDVSHPLLVYSQGPIINFSLLRPDGSYIGHTFVMQLAAMFNIHMRGGCFCNPGACHTALELSSEQVRENAEVHGHVCWDTKDIINDRPTGSLRVSFGACSTLDEAIAWLNFLKSTFLVGPLNPAAGPTLASSPPSTASSSVAQPHVQIITIYPIKSCGGYTPSTPWPIGETGFEMDRMWVVVDGEGRAITQKRVSRMALVKIVAVDLEQREVTVDAPGMPRCTVKWSIQDPGQAEEKAVRACSLGGEGRAVRVCGDSVRATQSADPTVSSWFSEFLKTPCQLVSTTSSTPRLTRSSPSASSPRSALSFANESQFLLVSTSSITAISQKVAVRNNQPPNTPYTDLPASRFRPNLTITNLPAFIEDTWVSHGTTIRIGTALFRVLGPCHRCQMVCIDQETGEKGSEPYATLAVERLRKGVGVVFGVHLVFVSMVGDEEGRRGEGGDRPVVGVGDVLEVI